jgi:transposase-like protein
VSCDYNPANKRPILGLFDGPPAQIGSSSSSHPESTEIDEEELSTSDDEESESSASPSHLSHSILGEGEMFHSASALSSTDTNGEGTTVKRPCTCTRSLEPGMCSICQQKSSLSSDTDKPVPDDAERIVSADGNNQDDSKDHHIVMFQCTPCFEFFETEESFRDHVCAFRTTMFRPHCPGCYTQFDDRSSLQKHLEGLQSFSCQFCLTRCCSDEMLLDHLFSHPTCGKCGKSFADDLTLCAVRLLYSHDHYIDKHCHSLILIPFVSMWSRTTRSWSVGIAAVLLSRTTVSRCITRTQLLRIQLVRSVVWAREIWRIWARFV